MVVFALTLVRHGETDYNLQSVIQGHVDVPLSETGQKQAKLLAIRLQNQKYSHIFASDLLRAFQTAESVLAENVYSNVSITKDGRLRERKFGEVEGKTFKFLHEEAKKCNQPIATFTPPGGETIKQVYHRAISFFKNLCENIIENDLAQQKVKHEAKRLKCDTVSFIDVPSSAKHSANILKELKMRNDCDKADADDTNVSQVPEHPAAQEGAATTIKCDDTLENDCFDKNIPNNSQPVASKANQIENKNEKHDKKYDVNSNLPSDMKSLSFAKMPQGGACFVDSSIVKTCGKLNDQKQFVLSFSDSSIRSNIHKSCGSHMNLRDECPNVSLSPLIEKQMSPFSDTRLHTCSTRKISVDSCDDDDLPPAIAANILIVSHGGFLRELLRYFVDELDCAVPGGKAQALRTCPNTGISRFTVSIQASDDKIQVTCLEIHDKDHLNIQNTFN